MTQNNFPIPNPLPEEKGGLVLSGRRATADLVRTPRALRLLARLLSIFALVVLLALIFAPWQQSVTGTGRVVAFTPVERQQEIDAPVEGRITKWNVREGSEVKAGDLLVELTDNDPEILQRLKAERAATAMRREAALTRADSIRARQSSLDSSRTAAARAASNRVSMAKERVRAARQAVEAAKAAMSTATINVERQESLHERGLVSRRAMELSQLEMVKTATEVERALATLQAAMGEEAALDFDRSKTQADLTASIDDARASEQSAMADVSNIDAELTRIDVRLARQDTMRIMAPMDGTVFRIRAGQGNAFVKSGEPLMTLVPKTTDRAVELWIDGNDMPLLALDRPVRLQFEGWPAVQFTGWPSVAVGTFGGRIALIDSTDDGKGRFRVLVSPGENDAWPTELYLRQGVRVNGWVLLEQVRLGYELWRRFNGFPPVVTAPAVTEMKGGDK